MAVVGGSIDTINLAGRNFAVAADNEAQLMLSGFNNEVQMNGNGTARKVMTRMPGGVDGLEIEIDDDRNDHQFIQSIADRKDFFGASVTLVDGVTWNGDMTIDGDFQRSTQKSTMTINLKGPNLTKQGV